MASEAKAAGYGGVRAAALATGMAPSVIGRGKAEIAAIENGDLSSLDTARCRRPGGGRKKTTEVDPTLLPDLKALVESTTRGDPISPLLWTARSQRNLVAALAELGHAVAKATLAGLLGELQLRHCLPSPQGPHTEWGIPRKRCGNIRPGSPVFCRPSP